MSDYAGGMRKLAASTAACLFAATAMSGAPAHASDGSEELTAYIQCAPYAREVSGIELYDDAHTWWDQAQGRYETGSAPRPGAVLAFRPHRSMELGHVATVSRVIDSRRVLLDHANWSPINGRRGQVEKDVLAQDVSAANDWSEVQVWYAPIGDLGTTRWPTAGFIYSDKARSPRPAGPVQIAHVPAPRKTSREFLSAFADYAE